MKQKVREVCVVRGKKKETLDLKYMRQFFEAFPNTHTLCAQLSWSHYRLMNTVNKFTMNRHEPARTRRYIFHNRNNQEGQIKYETKSS